MLKSIYLGMKLEENKKPLTCEKILSLIKGELSSAKILYATKEELLDILVNEQKEKISNEFIRLNNQTVDEKISEIFDFIEVITNILDKIQATIALQTGLGLLNKNRKNSIIEAKNTLKEDGIYGEKTKASLYNACKNYNSRIIKKYILKAVLNNIIFNTKNEDKIDTKKLLNSAKIVLEGKI